THVRSPGPLAARLVGLSGRPLCLYAACALPLADDSTHLGAVSDAPRVDLPAAAAVCLSAAAGPATGYRPSRTTSYTRFARPALCSSGQLHLHQRDDERLYRGDGGTEPQRF